MPAADPRQINGIEDVRDEEKLQNAVEHSYAFCEASLADKQANHTEAVEAAGQYGEPCAEGSQANQDYQQGQRHRSRKDEKPAKLKKGW